MNRIASLKAEVRKDGSNLYTVLMVPSDSNPKIEYTVDVTNGRCSCPAWKFQRGVRKTCKHLNRVGFAPKVEEELPPIEVLTLIPDDQYEEML